MATRIPVKGFNGLWKRGALDACPPDHLTVCSNFSFPGNGQARTREQKIVLKNFPGHTIVDYFPIVITVAGAQQTGYLFLDSDGKLYDFAGSLLATWTGADGFTAINIFGRTYLCPTQKGFALPGTDGFLYYYMYDSGSIFNLAGGAGPVSAPTHGSDAAGIVDAGDHKIYVAFQTRTGYISPLSPALTVTSDGVHNIAVTGIPTGGADVVARVIFMTVANQLEPFFVPGGTINDNTTTTFNIDVHDSALVRSADYLFDLQQPKIPAGSALLFYHGRLVIVGNVGAPNTILISKQNDPETFSIITDFISLPVDFGFNNSNGGMIVRDVLYITKPNATFSTQDNGNDPNTWPVTVTDAALGAFNTGISNFSHALPAQDVFDTAFLVHPSGLLLFNGNYSDPPLSWKIDDLWRTMNSQKVYLTQIAHDVWHKRVYVAFSNNQNFPDTLLMMDYKEGLTPQKVKWSEWSFFGHNIRKIAMVLGQPNLGATGLDYQFSFVSSDANIYTLDLNATIEANSINVLATAPLKGTDVVGSVAFFINLNLKMQKHGVLAITLTDQDGGNPKVIPAIVNDYPGQNYTRLINYTNEEMLVTLNTDRQAGSYMHLFELAVDVNTRYLARPSITQP